MKRHHKDYLGKPRLCIPCEKAVEFRPDIVLIRYLTDCDGAAVLYLLLLVLKELH